MSDFLEFIRKDYGAGVYRRHIVIRIVSEELVYAALEDEAHAFEIHLTHRAGKVVAVEPCWQRHPLTTCPSAGDALGQILEFPLSLNPLALGEFASAVENCTHFFDVASLMCTHAKACAGDCTLPEEYYYQMEVTDESQGCQRATLSLNGKVLLTWDMEKGRIKSPDVYDGVAVLKGLTRLCREKFDYRTTELSLMLQKAVFVARARFIRSEDMSGVRVKDTPQPLGVCYATRGGREDQAIRTGTRRDYSDDYSEILKFV